MRSGWGHSWCRLWTNQRWQSLRCRCWCDGTTWWRRNNGWLGRRRFGRSRCCRRRPRRLLHGLRRWLRLRCIDDRLRYRRRAERPRCARRRRRQGHLHLNGSARLCTGTRPSANVVINLTNDTMPVAGVPMCRVVGARDEPRFDHRQYRGPVFGGRACVGLREGTFKLLLDQHRQTEHRRRGPWRFVGLIVDVGENSLADAVDVRLFDIFFARSRFACKRMKTLHQQLKNQHCQPERVVVFGA